MLLSLILISDSCPYQEQEEKQILEDPAYFINTYRDALITDIGAASSTVQRLQMEDDQTDLVKKLQEARPPIKSLAAATCRLMMHRLSPHQTLPVQAITTMKKGLADLKTVEPVNRQTVIAFLGDTRPKA